MHPFNAEMTTKLYSERFTFHFKLLWLQVRQETKKCMQLFMGIFYQLCRPVSYFMSMYEHCLIVMVIQLCNLFRNLESSN